jgi:hypothetical protein
LTRACMRRWCRSATGPRCAGRGSNGRPDQGGKSASRCPLSGTNPDGPALLVSLLPFRAMRSAYSLRAVVLVPHAAAPKHLDSP